MKDKFIKSTGILLIGGLLTKILGMFIKMIIARELGPKGLGLYMLILPTFILLINLSQFGFPIALSKLISEDTKNNKKLFFSNLPIIIFINIVIIVSIIITSPYISNNLLHRKDTYISILAMSTVIPFTTISSICRSYFFGKQKMIPHVISNLIEDIVRLTLIIAIIPKIKFLKMKYIICILILFNIISEISSTLILIIFLPKNIKITKFDLKPKKSYIKESLKISIPTTSSQLIGSIALFLEPIILTSTLLKQNYSISYITTQYGIITGYIIPLILLPSFFTLSISQALLPIISKEYANKNIRKVKYIIKIAIIISLLIGISSTIIFLIIPKLLLKTIYNTTQGISYIKILAPICLLQYIQSPLSSILDAIGKSKDNLIATIIGTITRTSLLYILSYLRIGIWTLIISTSINIILTTIYQLKKVHKYL